MISPYDMQEALLRNQETMLEKQRRIAELKSEEYFINLLEDCKNNCNDASVGHIQDDVKIDTEDARVLRSFGYRVFLGYSRRGEHWVTYIFWNTEPEYIMKVFNEDARYLLVLGEVEGLGTVEELETTKEEIETQISEISIPEKVSESGNGTIYITATDMMRRKEKEEERVAREKAGKLLGPVMEHIINEPALRGFTLFREKIHEEAIEQLKSLGYRVFIFDETVLNEVNAPFRWGNVYMIFWQTEEEYVQDTLRVNVNHMNNVKEL